MLVGATDLDADFTIRSTHDRRLDTGGRLRSSVLRRRELGRVRMKIVETHPQREEPRERTATLALRAHRVQLRLRDDHGRRRGSLAITVVHVCEPGATRRTRIEWFLLTNVKAETADEALSVVQAYRARWRVEEFHRAWKSGVCVPLFTLKGPPGFQGHGTRGVRATEAQHARRDARLSSRRRAVARRRSRVSGVFGAGASCPPGLSAAGCCRRASA